MSRADRYFQHHSVRHVVCTLVLLVLLLSKPLSGRSQPDSAGLPKIEFRDKVMERNLHAFARQNRDKIIEVGMHMRDSVRVYTIIGVFMLQTLERLADARYVTWGQWYGRTVVISGDPALFQVCTVTIPASVDKLIDYAADMLGEKRTIKKQRWIQTAYGLVEELGEAVTACGMPEWELGVKNNREEWLWMKGYYDSRDIVVPGTFR